MSTIREKMACFYDLRESGKWKETGYSLTVPKDSPPIEPLVVTIDGDHETVWEWHTIIRAAIEGSEP
jgi:hypothetical protein